MSEEMNKEAEVQEEAVDIPVTDGSEEEAADTAQTAEEETSEEPAQTEETEQSDQEAESQKEPETKTKTSFFGKKKKEYTASKIVITKEMGTSDVMDWNLESITKRDIRVSDEVVKIMNRWNNEYLNTPVSEGKAGEPSEEELAQIEKFKKNGWI